MRTRGEGSKNPTNLRMSLMDAPLHRVRQTTFGDKEEEKNSSSEPGLGYAGQLSSFHYPFVQHIKSTL